MGGSMSKILPGVYIGNLHDATDEEEMTKNNITHVLSIHDNARPLLIDKVYLCINANDSLEQDMLCHIPECNDFIHSARLSGGGVLVHCLAGVSRSATIVIAYVMTMTGLDWRSAITAVQEARSYVNPNFSFQRQLLKYEHDIMNGERDRLKKKYGPSPFDDKAETRRLLADSLRKQATVGISTVSSANSYPFGRSTTRRLPEYEDDKYESAPAATDVLRTVVRANRLGRAYDKATSSGDKTEQKSAEYDATSRKTKAQQSTTTIQTCETTSTEVDDLFAASTSADSKQQPPKQ